MIFETTYFKLAILFFVTVYFMPLSPVFAGEVYKWADENGTVNFSDSLSNIPPKYRGQLEKREMKNKERTSSDSTQKSSSKLETVPAPTVKKEGEPKKCEVPYVAQEGAARRVIVQVRFNDKVSVPMLLDTGATGISISLELAERLGLLDDGESKLFVKIGGIGGTQEAIRTILSSVQVGDFKEEFIPAKITKRFSTAFEGLIGMDFMGNYSFSINTKKKLVEIEEDPARNSFPAGRDEEWWRNHFQELDYYRDGWKGMIALFEKKITDLSMYPSQVEELKVYKAYSESQYREAENLLTKLNRFAIDNHVPVHWRRARH